MKTIIKSFVLLLVFFHGSFAVAQLSQDTASRVDALFAGHSQDEPGGMLIISRNGRQIYRKVFGVTNLEQPSPITGETLFPAASVSKQFTAAGILLLVQEGKLSLDDNVRKYVPELPDYGKEITVRHLLTHTSGLRDWWNVTYITGNPSGYKVFDQAFALQYICRQKGLNYAPGERYSYTNTGYDLAAIIIARISGISFSDFINQRLLIPAGMSHSRFRHDFRDVIKNMASGYYTSANRFVKGYVLDETNGAAGLITTAEDLAKWNEFIHNSVIGKSISGLREERYVLNNGDTITYANGGINVSTINGVKEITHSGLEGGYRALCSYYPEKGLSVTYMSNNKDISTVLLRKDIAEIFFGKIPAQDPLEKILAEAAGKEKIRNSGNKNVSASLNNKVGVFLNCKDESDFLKIHELNGRLVNYGAELRQLLPEVFMYESRIYLFLPGGDTVRVNNLGETDTYFRVPDYVPTKKELSDFTGLYYSDDADVTLDIELKGNQLIAYRHTGDYVVLSPYFRLGDRCAFRGIDHGLRATYFFPRKEKTLDADLIISLPRAAGIPFTRK